MTGTPHIEAARGDFAETVLMPGDPLRAQALADNHLDNVRQVNRVRNMLGFTGTWKGIPVSIMGSGMGMPSISIYAHELFDYFGVQQIIRVGTCGGLLADMQIGDLVLASAASTDSVMNRQRFNGWDFAAAADSGSGTVGSSGHAFTIGHGGEGVTEYAGGRGGNSSFLGVTSYGGNGGVQFTGYYGEGESEETCGTIAYDGNEVLDAGYWAWGGEAALGNGGDGDGLSGISTSGSRGSGGGGGAPSGWGGNGELTISWD